MGNQSCKINFAITLIIIGLFGCTRTADPANPPPQQKITLNADVLIDNAQAVKAAETIQTPEPTTRLEPTQDQIIPQTETIPTESATITTPEASPTEPPTSITWDQAVDHIGEDLKVCGIVVSTKFATSTKGQPTFLNIGNPYPDTNRFTALIWGDDRPNFPTKPEITYLNQSICVDGIIEQFEGVPEIVVTHPSQITPQQ